MVMDLPMNPAGTQTATSASVSQRHLDAGTCSPALFLARISGVNRFIRLLAAIVLIALAASSVSAAASGAVTIGPEASVALPSSAKQRLFVGTAPDDGSVQTLNPPIFKWIYFNDPWHMGAGNSTLQTFRFQ